MINLNISNWQRSTKAITTAKVTAAYRDVWLFFSQPVTNGNKHSNDKYPMLRRYKDGGTWIPGPKSSWWYCQYWATTAKLIRYVKTSCNKVRVAVRESAPVGILISKTIMVNTTAKTPSEMATSRSFECWNSTSSPHCLIDYFQFTGSRHKKLRVTVGSVVDVTKVALKLNNRVRLNCHSGWPSIGWNVVATFVSRRSVSQAGLWLTRKNHRLSQTTPLSQFWAARR